MNTNTIIQTQLFEYSNNPNICGNTALEKNVRKQTPIIFQFFIKSLLKAILSLVGTPYIRGIPLILGVTPLVFRKGSESRKGSLIRKGSLFTIHIQEGASIKEGVTIQVFLKEHMLYWNARPGQAPIQMSWVPTKKFVTGTGGW